MVDQPGGRGQRDPNVLRLGQYADCPTCQVILPLYDDPPGGKETAVRQATAAR
jgi:hypothetical protein